MTNTKNIGRALHQELKGDWREEARQARLVKPEVNLIDRKKLDEWLTKEMATAKRFSCHASDMRQTYEFGFYKGRIEALQSIRRQLRENYDILGLLALGDDEDGNE